MLRGIDTLAGAVRMTLGPKGRSVALDKSFGPRITKDGVTVAKEIELADCFENMGAQMVKEMLADLERNSKKVTASEEIAQVGTISANGEAEIGRLIAEAMYRVGDDG